MTSRKRRILHLLNNYGDSSISRIVERLIARIGREEFVWHVGVMNGYGDMRDDYAGLGAQVADFSSPQLGPGGIASRLRSYVIKNGIDIIHSHTPRTIMTAGLALRRVERTQHLATKHILQASKDRKFGAIFSLIDKASLYVPDHLVAVSKRIKDEITAYPGIGKDRVTVIQNAIDCDAFCQSDCSESVRSEFGIEPDAPIIGCAVRIEKVKRLDLLLEGFAKVLDKFPLARLMIVGDGKSRAELVNYCKRLGIERSVIWPGFRTDVPRLLASLDIYIQSSINEGLSLSILEAMAAGKALIITDVGGAREVITDGKTGVLIQPGSPAAITSALEDLLSDPQKRNRIAEDARDHVRREFDLQKMTDAYRAAYERLLSGQNL